MAATFTGDGATSEGDFHEALNLAARVEAARALRDREQPVGPLHAGLGAVRLPEPGRSGPRATACRARIVDGNDVIAVHRAVSRAAERARRGDGPTLLEFKTFRMRGHEEASGTDYVPKEMLEQWAQKDPLARLEKLLLDKSVLTAADRDATRAAYKARIDVLVDEALAAPGTPKRRPRSCSGTSTRRAGSSPKRPPRAAEVAELRYVDAISDALRVAMRRNDKVVLLGQDIAEYGGVFKVTEGFVAEFGKARVRNTPIIESGALGCALGLALDGFVPMVEMQFGDFITCGFNQIVNNLAKTHFRWGARVPVVVRAPIGGGTGAGPVPFPEPRVVVHAAWRASRSWRPPRPTTPRACSSRPSRTATPCCTSSTSSCTARPGARCPRGTTRCRWARRGWRARAGTPPSSPTAWASSGPSRRRRPWPRRAARSRSSTSARSCPGTRKR